MRNPPTTPSPSELSKAKAKAKVKITLRIKLKANTKICPSFPLPAMKPWHELPQFDLQNMLVLATH
jgi:hypothetical protein